MAGVGRILGQISRSPSTPPGLSPPLSMITATPVKESWKRMKSGRTFTEPYRKKRCCRRIIDASPTFQNPRSSLLSGFSTKNERSRSPMFLMNLAPAIARIAADKTANSSANNSGAVTPNSSQTFQHSVPSPITQKLVASSQLVNNGSDLVDFKRKLSQSIGCHFSEASSTPSVQEPSFVNFTPDSASGTLPIEIDSPTRENMLVKGIDAFPFKPVVVGQGGFGTVIRAEHKGSHVAVKIISKQKRRRRSVEYCLHGELNALALSHPHIVRTLGIFGSEQNVNALVLMEFAGDTNLQKILDDPVEQVDVIRRHKFGCQLAAAIKFCHENKLAHLDVKPANVIIGFGDLCKLCDFGCSRRVDLHEEPYYRSFPMDGTVAYRSPELLRGSIPSLKADVYSFGITLWQIWTREFPFNGMDPHVIVYKVVACGLRPMTADRMLAEEEPELQTYMALFLNCWDAQPEARPTVENIISKLDISLKLAKVVD